MASIPCISLLTSTAWCTNAAHGGFFFDERDTLIRELAEARRAIMDRFYGVVTACFLIPWQVDDGSEGFGDGEPVG